MAFRVRFTSYPYSRILVYDLRRGTLGPVCVDANADWPVWTPDGERLVFNRFTPDQQNMYWTRADGAGTPEPLLPPNPTQQHAQEFSPDGRFLVYQQRPFPNAPDSDLWLLPVSDGAEPRPLLSTPAFEIQPTLSLDGRWMAYVSNDSGQDEIYVTDFPDARRRWKVSTERAWGPAWSPTGDEIFYRSWMEGASSGGEIWAVSVSTGATFHAGVPEVLIEGAFSNCCAWGRGYDVSADGRRLLVV